MSRARRITAAYDKWKANEGVSWHRDVVKLWRLAEALEEADMTVSDGEACDPQMLDYTVDSDYDDTFWLRSDGGWTELTKEAYMDGYTDARLILHRVDDPRQEPDLHPANMEIVENWRKDGRYVVVQQYAPARSGT